MVRAIGREAVLQKAYLSDTVETIYFGGGTPSLLSEEQLLYILTTINEQFTVAPDAEITLESNPDDITEAALESWRKLGINRLSIGIQSFFEEDLRWMNRAHNATQAADAIQLAQRHGFHNITVDLIYGSPGLTDAKWEQNVKRVLDAGVPHVSCYAMTVEPRTALAKMIETSRTKDIDPTQQAQQFHLLVSWLEAAGFEHYEISNFARPGFRSRHNSSYWQGKPYLGLGPSAHSFNLHSRQWNIANNALYIAALQKDTLPFEQETLTRAQQFNEYVMTALRTMEGISLEHITQRWPAQLPILHQAAQKHLEAGHLAQRNNALVLTRAGKFLADGIASDLFLSEEDF